MWDHLAETGGNAGAAGGQLAAGAAGSPQIHYDAPDV